MATNAEELSDAEIIARKQLREYLAFLRSSVPGYEHAEIHSVAAQIGVRESRRILGLEYLTVEAFDRQARFKDAIARVNYPVDIHNPSGTGTEMRMLKPDEYYEIPYGCIVPPSVKNLLIGCRAISVDHALHSSMRVMPPVCSIGRRPAWLRRWRSSADAPRKSSSAKRCAKRCGSSVRTSEDIPKQPGDRSSCSGRPGVFLW